jgi:hypothetical protein
VHFAGSVANGIRWVAGGIFGRAEAVAADCGATMMPRLIRPSQFRGGFVNLVRLFVNPVVHATEWRLLPDGIRQSQTPHIHSI